MKNKKHPLLIVFILFWAVCLSAQPTEVPGTGLINLHNSKIAVGDINNDGQNDVIIAGVDISGTYQCKVYSNNGNNTFADLGANIISLIDGDIALADFNSDNYLDIAICGRDQSNIKYSRIYRNNKNNTFTDISAGLQGLYLGSSSWADYDNDGDLDLLICGQDATNVRKTLIYENQGSETFTEVVPNIPGVFRGQATWGDINNDGFIDIALSGLNNSNVYITEIYANNGGKTFSSHNANLQKLAFSSQHLIDYDNDGDLDFWISGSSSNGTDFIKLYKNTLGNFSEVTAGFNALWGTSSSWGDYDSDGDADLIYMGLNSTTPYIYYYQNNGSGFTLIDLSTEDIAEGDIVWSDFNNDNKLDILVSGFSPGGSETILYRNNSASANTAPSSPTGLSANISGNQVNLSWTAGTDAQTPVAGFSYRLCLGTSSNNYNILSPIGNIGTGKSYLSESGLIKTTLAVLKNLPYGKYYWRVQAIDASGGTSVFSDESSFAVCLPVSLGSDREICTKGLLELSAGEVTDQVNWYSEKNGLILSNNKNLSTIILQNDKIRVEIIKDIGCTIRDTIEVTVLPLPTFSLPATDAACYGKSLSYNAGTNNETVKWFSKNGNLLYIGNQLDYKVSANETIKCEITAVNFCIDSAKISITSYALPQASLGDDFGICNGLPAQLQISNMEKVNWYAFPWAQIATNKQNIEINLSSDTTIVAEFYNLNNCVNYDTINISINQIKYINAGNDTTICYHTGLTLGGNPVANGGSAPYSYSWTDEQGLLFSSEANPVVNPAINTTYHLHVSDNNSCEGTDKIKVEINPQSVIDAGPDIDICLGNNTQLGGNPTAANSLFNYTYHWFPEIGLSDPSSPNPIANPKDTTIYKLIVGTYLCPADTALVTINVIPSPKIVISPDIIIGYGENTILEASGGVKYEWSPIDGLATPYFSQTEASPEATTTYVVTVSDETECKSQASVTVTVQNNLFIPSLFTPNGDGNNDLFKIYGIGIEEIKMIIYNRNGNIVFQSNDVSFMLETGWDGTTNGSKQPQGSYIYVISGIYIDGSRINYNNNKGTINLMR